MRLCVCCFLRIFVCLWFSVWKPCAWGMQEGRAASKHCNPLLSQRKWTTERPSLAFTSVLGLTHFCPSVLVFRFLSVCLCIFICVFVNHGNTMLVLLSLTSVFQTLRFCELCLSRILHYFHMCVRVCVKGVRFHISPMCICRARPDR